MAPGQALPETDQLGLGVRLHPNDRGIDDPAAVKGCDEFVGGGPSVYDFPVLQGSPGSGVLTPVSYTHLDVYKRQRSPKWK